ncbi:bifunctional proline dehydrogenase/L-glutamate gamma-semialdehyde dehydrogenase PutA [Pseudooceanicola sp. CBS1P-1]|uniref:Bifunctional protein PutA n=1 Tax=Pseudooceanicola albus TaxID=2692189 RepID=A0A6L7GB13_9RHOB|nr:MULTISPECIES: bifunctional proline dehydrogenase/L-glutamate gamma-semialdehyde dehydrogenase PutA [Pseudooceanicola]MBT9385741.1 bifunctional proline dehydrogenase/L-glutamate gamma-semialdehyde dehydrogenase PutA [Pseudooceanicola endophyticus]MXN19973.1 bifunctional proline dehydrogenase/L-glutamate gamma-semialdehyde dehydrogenase PutA [Pseudooceanicola albus]
MIEPKFDALQGPAKYADETKVLERLVAQAALSPAARQMMSHRAADYVRKIRSSQKPTLMEHFLGEYGLSTREGVALMCLAEAMLRVPDKLTIDALIEDKIAPSDWSAHVGKASSPLVNASTWALMLTGKVLEDERPGMASTLRGAVRRLGEPVIRSAVGRAMKEMGRQFVLGETIVKALERAKTREAMGFTYSYDMLGEAAMTGADAARYARDYSDAIDAIAKACDKGSVEANPGISIKLSALHPRYEVSDEARVLRELVPVVLELALKAKAAGMGLNIDAEEQDRLVLSLKVIEAVLRDERLAGWNGFGVVVQAYGKRASFVIDWLYTLATELDRRIMVRLVKGAYWDTEMKHAQVEGLPGFTLFTSKTATDVSYIANARKLIGYGDRIYPQFATHNAHTVAAILEMVGDVSFEFQRLHGMGERLHDIVLKETKGRCRIYAPVGAHRDLLAYLVRRLLENGANSSFVNQIVDEEVAPETIAADPFEALARARAPAGLVKPDAIFGADRLNSRGFDLTDETVLAALDAARDLRIPDAGPLVAGTPEGRARPVVNPATGVLVAQVTEASEGCVAEAIAAATPWAASPDDRAAVLRRAADLYEENFGAFFAVLAREAGKSLPDAVGELREAVDFLRFYAAEGARREDRARGIFTCISPWNFPLAIFTGQIAAALAAGNGVLAKPAEQTGLVAAMAVRLLLQAGVPATALQLLPGDGRVGAQLTSDARIAGVAFTGSTETAQIIRRAMAATMDPGAPLIAETGGLNAMVVDSTALPEQAVRDIVASAFQSAGQRCSALRCLYVQEDIAPHLIEMIKGAMDELTLGDPWHLTTDVGPVIDAEAQQGITGYIAQKRDAVLHALEAPAQGTFVAPTLLKVPGIEALEREIFGPVLHVATYRAAEIDKVIAAINATGYGLTFGLHTRIDTRVQEITEAVHAGNLYVNRNQIGAIVGSQPFGGEGLSGTGPKAGGPNYLDRFRAPETPAELAEPWAGAAEALPARLAAMPGGAVVEDLLMPGPTGELNRLTLTARDPILCMGPGKAAEEAQLAAVRALGGCAVAAGGRVEPAQLKTLGGISGAMWWGDADSARAFAQALAARPGAILPLITALPDRGHAVHERHLCVDTTAAGGNAALLAGKVE